MTSTLFIGIQIDVCAKGVVSGKALAAGLLETPAASALPLTRNCEISANINLSPNNPEPTATARRE